MIRDLLRLQFFGGLAVVVVLAAVLQATTAELSDSALGTVLGANAPNAKCAVRIKCPANCHPVGEIKYIDECLPDPNDQNNACYKNDNVHPCEGQPGICKDKLGGVWVTPCPE